MAWVRNVLEKSNIKYQLTELGKVEKILVEGKSKTNEKMLTGRTNSNKVLVFEGKEELIGNVVDVEIISEHKWYLKGKIK